MKKYVKTPLFLSFVSVLAVLLIAVGTFSIVMTVQNAKLEKKVDDAILNMQEKVDLYEEISKKNDDLQKQNSSLQGELDKMKETVSNLEKQVKDQKKLLDSANMKKLIQAEAVLATQNSPQPTVAPKNKVCYLTFDDGPSDRTLEILDILDKYNAKATFFVVGSSKLQYLPKIAEKGHTIGLHSNTHKYATIYKSTDAYFKDLNALSDKVFNITGTRSKVIRFPGGGSNKVSKSICKGIMTRLTNQVRIQGYAYFDWNVDSGDAASKGVTAKSITDNVLNAAAKKDSICVLMHDISSKKATVEALPQILEGLKKMGYTFEPLTEKSYGYCHKVNN